MLNLFPRLIFVLFLVLFASCKWTKTDQKVNQTRPEGLPDYSRITDFDLDKIRERGSLIAIVDNSSTGYFIYKGQPMGYEYELLDRFAANLGVTLEITVVSNVKTAFEKLNNGEGDIIAYNLAVTRDRKNEVAFTDYHSIQHQVLVQRKPENWRSLTRDQLEERLIRDPIELIGKEVYVRKNSSFAQRLHNLSDELGDDIIIIEGYEDVETEELIRKVSQGEIDFTVADENVARVNATYLGNLDVKTPVSFSQQIAWAVRLNSDQLLEVANEWIKKMKKTSDYYVIYKKYFNNPKKSVIIATSEYSTVSGSKLSPYDELIKNAASDLEWDWLLLASQIYQESRFDPNAVSWAGARGLMQLMPLTARHYKVGEIYDPAQNIAGGKKHILWLMDLWEEKVDDPNERIKFILASYNVGHRHILDARRLAVKYGDDPEIWEGSVSEYLLKKSDPKYYMDPVVKSGYCRGTEPVNYVRDILERYQQYQQITAL
jgi:membrane-bound lytic murein transglycosylase F